MNMNLDEICSLWKYQHSECRFTNFLKTKIDGYDNGKVYDVEQAKKDRQQWLNKLKFNPNQKPTQLKELKQEYLEQLLHPQNIYLKPKKADYEITKEPYWKNDPILKTYENVAKANLQPNIVKFKIQCEVQNQSYKDQKKHINYLKTFYNKFGDILTKQSPQFANLLLLDILDKIVKNQKKSNDALYHELNILLQGQKTAIDYIITFRQELTQLLMKSKMNEAMFNELKIKVNQENKPIANKGKQTKFYQNQSQGSQVIDFIQSKQSELIQKIPNLSRRDYNQYIHFRIEPMPKIQLKSKNIEISKEISFEYRQCFQSEYLNTIQSEVFDYAFNQLGNMLICAPTGAGKTNIATLSILKAINSVKNAEDVRVVYISPMKALANELVNKFTAKLVNLKTRQSTGDIQLSQKQLLTTNILITTPEKWDVMTRKGTTIFENLNLFILDQIHLLNDERGWVIQNIVARMFRTIERTQKQIRIVALSATLPNYHDVAEFLRVTPEGLFNFGQQYRPVPLSINFIGVKNPKSSNNNMSSKTKKEDIYDNKCYQMAYSYLKNDKQVLIFVHTRKETVKFCKFIVKQAKINKDQSILKHVSGNLNKYKNISDRCLKQMVIESVGFHHAGMIRTDRNIVQNMFHNGDVKILVATATLAWGVNLPAYAVIIKGTEIYDPNQRLSKDLSVLDVQQMFGRAGRPQYDIKGQATIMSDHDKVNHYLGILTNSSSIDSKLLTFMQESLNAQICSGSVTSEDEAFSWLKYTFLAVRLRRNPQVYGCCRGATSFEQECNYDQFLRKQTINTLKKLENMRLIKLNYHNFTVTSTELSRITSHYYIRCETMNHLCKTLHIFPSQNPGSIHKKFDYKTDLQILTILSQCKEFQNIVYRQKQEEQQLNILLKKWILKQEHNFNLQKDKTIANIADTTRQQKVILLLQGYLMNQEYKTFSLRNDTHFIVQNSIRLLRCMLDLCTKKNQPDNVHTILNWCKFVENRVYRDDSPLKQFTKVSYSGYNTMRMKKQIQGFLPQYLYRQFQQQQITTEQFLQSDDDVERMALLQLKYSPKSFNLIKDYKRFCRMLPRVTVEQTIKPIANTILKIHLKITPQWQYNPKWHSKSQSFWVLFDNEKQMLHSEMISIDETFVIRHKPITTSFYIRCSQDFKNYRLLVTSDRWLIDYSEQKTINLDSLGLKMDTMPFTQLLSIDPLPVTALKNPLFEQLYRFKFFNPIQSQVFFSLYQTSKNILIGAPTGSGKTIMSELAVLNMFKQNPQAKCVYIAPLKSLVKERMKDWCPRFKTLRKSVVELSGDFTPDIEALRKANIIVTTPEKWDGITRNKERQYTRQVGLVIFDEIHLLGQERGAVLEVIVSRMNKESKVRMIGLSTAMANGTDVAEWFGTDQYGFFNFKPQVRPVPIEIHFQGFSEKFYCPRMATMNKPAFNHIRKFSDGKPVIIFVSSRRQTRLTADDLIIYSQMYYKDQLPYIIGSQNIIQKAVEAIHDDYLKKTLSFGIVMHHAGLDNHDREICEQLFVHNKVQIMVATSTLAWGVNFPARLVIIKGTEYFDAKTHKYVDFPATDLLQMIGRAGRPQYDDKGVAFVYCQASKKNFYAKFLNDPFPIESSLHEQIDDHINAEIARGQINNLQDCIEWITWSFMFRRILKNPTYYGLEGNTNQQIKQFLALMATKSFEILEQSKCINCHESEDGELYVMPTEIGFVASNYYLRNKTVYFFSKVVKKGLSFKDILRIISDAQQFKQTPLRHNEDQHNRQLSKISPFKATNYSSPQDKTFLLLQMHLYNLPYPIRDYLNDCKLILDSSCRVIMGLIQIAKDKRLFDVVHTCILVQQALYQGLGCNIPFITWDNWLKVNQQFQGLAGLIEKYQSGFRKQIITFLKSIVVQFDSYKEQKILEAIDSFPCMKMNIRAANFDSEDMVEKKGAIKEGGQALLHINIQKQNEGTNRIMVQKMKKIKDVTWWIIVKGRSNELLGLKKISVSHKVHVKIQIQVPEDFNDSVHVYLLADSYIGLDQVQKVLFW